jgi:DNA repair protein RadC
MKARIQRRKLARTPAEFKIVRLRECPVDSPIMGNPEQVEKFWRAHVVSAPWFSADKECLVVFLLNTRRHLLGFEMLSQGTKDALLVNVGETFRLAAARNASAIIIAHNHPSGDPAPSEADIKFTRDLLRAGAVLKIDLLDSIIIGTPLERGANRHASLRAIGCIGDCESCPGYVCANGSNESAAVTAAPSSVPPREFSFVEFDNAINQSVALMELLEHRIVYGELGTAPEPYASAFEGGLVELTSETQRRLMAVREDYSASVKGGAQ